MYLAEMYVRPARFDYPRAPLFTTGLRKDWQERGLTISEESRRYERRSSARGMATRWRNVWSDDGDITDLGTNRAGWSRTVVRYPRGSVMAATYGDAYIVATRVMFYASRSDLLAIVAALPHRREIEHTGGNCTAVVQTMGDGSLIVGTDEGVSLWSSRAHWEGETDQDMPLWHSDMGTPPPAGHARAIDALAAEFARLR